MKSNSDKIKKVDKLIFVDNLEISFSGILPIPNALTDKNGNRTKHYFNTKWFIEYQYGGNRQFQRIADLWIKDSKIGEFRFSPRANYLDSKLINFKFENNILYQEKFHDYIDSIARTLKLKFLYISHLDIAVDCIDHGLLKFVINYLNQYNKKEKYLTRHKGKVDIETVRTNLTSIIYWGNIKSHKYLKIYDKTKILNKTGTDKGYIPVCWLENGMITENKSVERFELTIRQKHAKLYDYHKLSDSDYLASIMQTQCKNFFDFEQTFKNHSKTRKRNVTPINFKGFNTVLLPKFKYLPKNTLHNEKVILKQLYFQYLLAEYIASDDYVKTGNTFVSDIFKNYPDIYSTIEASLVKYPALRNYFDRKKNGWEKEFNRTNPVASGKQSIDDYIQSLESKIYKGNRSEYKDTLGLLGLKRNEMQLADLENRCRSIELVGLATNRQLDSN